MNLTPPGIFYTWLIFLKHLVFFMRAAFVLPVTFFFM